MNHLTINLKTILCNICCLYTVYTVYIYIQYVFYTFYEIYIKNIQRIFSNGGEDRLNIIVKIINENYF